MRHLIDSTLQADVKLGGGASCIWVEMGEGHKKILKNPIFKILFYFEVFFLLYYRNIRVNIKCKIYLKWLVI